MAIDWAMHCCIKKHLEQCGMQGGRHSAARPSWPLNNSRLPDDDQIGQNEEQHSKNVLA